MFEDFEVFEVLIFGDGVDDVVLIIDEVYIEISEMVVEMFDEFDEIEIENEEIDVFVVYMLKSKIVNWCLFMKIKWVVDCVFFDGIDFDLCCFEFEVYVMDVFV